MIVVATTLLVFAAILRICGAQNGLWLDEIWTLNLTSQISSPMDVFDKIHLDNNHYLNTLFLYLMGPRGNWPGYRIPSVLAGIGTVALAGLIGQTRDTASAFLAMVLIGFSYVMVLYSSEARGFSTLVFFSFLSYHLMGCYLKNQRWPTALGFSLSASLGFLSHLTFVSFFLSAFLWTACRFIKSSLGFKDIILFLISCYALPTMVVVTLFFVDIRYMQIGGGAEPGLFNCYVTALAWIFGTLPVISVALGLTVILFAMGVLMLWRQEKDLVVFFVSTVVVAPLLVAWLNHATVLYVRYFIIPISFALILLSFFLASLCQRPGYWGKITTLVVLSGYMAANGWHLMTLFQYGRGDDREAFHYMLQNTKGSVVTVGGDQDFRIGTAVQFYTANELHQKTVRYCTQTSWPSDGVEWLVCEKESFENLISPSELTAEGHVYELARIFPASPLSGLHWFVYRRRADYPLIINLDH